MPTFRRGGTRLLIERSWMLFVDGENFAKRGQAVLSAAGAKPDSESRWLKDVFLWFPTQDASYPILRPIQYRSSFQGPGPEPRNAPYATRAYYYTSMPYDEAGKVTSARLAIRDAGFEPRVFPRRRQGRSKAVDLALATDVLTLAGEEQYEVAVLFAGDGDYVPVVEAVKRLGRHVVVGFFAGEGLSDELRIAADDFLDLTDELVGGWTAYWQRRAKEEEAAKKKADTQAAT
jgi:hypothetical protein